MAEKGKIQTASDLNHNRVVKRPIEGIISTYVSQKKRKTQFTRTHVEEIRLENLPLPYMEQQRWIYKTNEGRSVYRTNVELFSRA